MGIRGYNPVGNTRYLMMILALLIGCQKKIITTTSSSSSASYCDSTLTSMGSTTTSNSSESLMIAADITTKVGKIKLDASTLSEPEVDDTFSQLMPDHFVGMH